MKANWGHRVSSHCSSRPTRIAPMRSAVCTHSLRLGGRYEERPRRRHRGTTGRLRGHYGVVPGWTQTSIHTCTLNASPCVRTAPSGVQTIAKSLPQRFPSMAPIPQTPKPKPGLMGEAPSHLMTFLTRFDPSGMHSVVLRGSETHVQHLCLLHQYALRRAPWLLNTHTPPPLTSRYALRRAPWLLNKCTSPTQ